MLTPESLKLIDYEVSKYPKGRARSAVMAALRIAQQEKGWLSPETIEFVAQYLHIPAVAAYEVATFYNMYDLEPVGKNKLTICTNLPCALRGACEAAAYLKKTLGIEFGETTVDGQFTLKEGECFGSCSDVPVILHNNHRVLRHMSIEKLKIFLAEKAK